MALSQQETDELELLQLQEEEEAEGAAAPQAAPSEPIKPPQPAQAPRSDLQRLGNVIQSVRQGRPADPNQSTFKDALDLTSAPFRGIRGLAVGAGRAIAGEPAQKTLQRTSDAMQPDFKPETTAEKVANASSMLLEVAAPLAQGSRAVKAGRVLTEVGSLKGAKGALEALKSKAGINVEKAVEPIARKAATPLVNALTNLRKADALKKLPLQDLHEAEVGLRNLLDAEKVGGFARLMGKKPAGTLTDQGVALAAKAKEAVIKAQNLRVKGLDVARRRVGDIATRNRVVRRLVYGTLAGVAAKKILGPAAPVISGAVSEVSR